MRKRSMKDRIRAADSLEELERLISEAEDFRDVRPDTSRRIKRAANERRKELK